MLVLSLLSLYTVLCVYLDRWTDVPSFLAVTASFSPSFVFPLLFLSGHPPFLLNGACDHAGSFIAFSGRYRSGSGSGLLVACFSLRLSYLGFLAYTAYARAFACLVGWRARGFVIALAVERVVGLILCLLAVFWRTTPYRRA
jgi:hypothetical protein